MTTGRGLLGLLATALLVACGGGGGGGSAAPAATPAVIDSTSAPLIAREVMLVGFGAADFGAALGGSGLLAANGGSNALALRLGRRQALAAGSPSPSATLAPETVDCLVGGTMRLSGTLASDQTLTPGDRLNATFTDCDDGDGAVYDGRLLAEVTDFDGDLFAGQYFLAAGITFTDFRVTDAGGSATATGDMNLELDLSVPEAPIVASSGSELAVSTDDGSWVLRDYALIQTVDPDADAGNGLAYQSTTGTLEGSGFEGAVDFLTVEPFATRDDGTLAGGEALITGAGDATIRVTADGVGGLLLALDLNGDGQVDETQEIDG